MDSQIKTVPLITAFDFYSLFIFQTIVLSRGSGTFDVTLSSPP